jgi:hypothetical protein
MGRQDCRNLHYIEIQKEISFDLESIDKSFLV